MVPLLHTINVGDEKTFDAPVEKVDVIAGTIHVRSRDGVRIVKAEKSFTPKVPIAGLNVYSPDGANIDVTIEGI